MGLDPPPEADNLELVRKRACRIILRHTKGRVPREFLSSPESSSKGNATRGAGRGRGRGIKKQKDSKAVLCTPMP
eukprot:6177537-Pleurochrysis_carterae.AAC.1